MVNKFTTGIILLLLFCLVAKAQDFEVSPVILNFQAEPGGSDKIKLSIINHSSKKSDFQILLNDFEINPKGEKVMKNANTTKHSISPVLSYNQPKISLPPNGRQEIIVEVQAPSDDNSTKWGYLIVKAVSEQTSFNADKALRTGVALNAQIAVLLYQSPKSNKNYKGKISNFIDITTEKDTMYRFNADIVNIGDKILNCKVYIMSADLNTAEEKQFPPTNFTSFPETTCTIELKIPKKLGKGTYVLAAILDYGNNATLEGTQTLLEVK